MAEGVFKHMAKEAGLSDKFHVESAGIGPWHVGEPADPRARKTAQSHGVALTEQAQQFLPRDFERCDEVLALDEDVAAALRRLAHDEKNQGKVRLLREYDPEARGDLDVPDPYYGGQEGFETVYRMIERSCRELLRELERGLPRTEAKGARKAHG